MSEVVKKPSLNTETYPAISADALRGCLNGEVVIVTGAGGGLGRGESVAFANAGAKLALIDIPEVGKRLNETVYECERLGAVVKRYFCDVTDSNESLATLKQIENDLGPVDVLVNNAGMIKVRPFHMIPFDQFWSVIDLNFKAPMLWMHMLINSFRQRKKGKIINIASRSATINTPFSVNYGSSKAALVRAGGCLQLELDMDGFDDVHVYSLHPGATKTYIQNPLDPDVAEKYPAMADGYLKFSSNFKCTPALCGQTCVYLAAGKGTVLKGRYFDCEQDVGYVSSMGHEIRDKNLYDMKVDFLGGLPNDGGTTPDSMLREL